MAAQKPSGTLKKFLDTKKVNSRLIGPLERHMLTRPPDTSRRTDVLHPSDLIKSDFCARAAYFTVTGVPTDKERPNLRLQSIFDEGHAIHHKWQTWIREGGWLYGAWKCDYCGEYFWDTAPESCPSCKNTSYLKYKEVPLIDEELMIAGHSDGWVKGLEGDFLIEIKSIGPGTIRMEQPSIFAANDGDLAKSWRDIRRPFPTHLRQGQFYLELLRRMGEKGIVEGPIPTEIVFVYELKMDQSYKEFVVQADPVVVKDALDTAYDIVVAVNTGQPPACTNSISGTCKQCEQFEEVA